ncbi:hypothetical protein N7509_012670 [Penicillium cosmopolitanum]|uniref:NAD dependent epimerase/dehydratase n=1 Tax=Penicillium cosmopolitanum TaxID=1131564 RepID=A0A9W9SJ46_9EURO|nr:uncharacterized protein N7509_012670 [Penicillium cosmopolitanum]KAJ5379551.1 hypothetical protein N7509_012670 [Penicillium cosmopolitanum]
MSRNVDKLPMPAEVKKMKVVVASASRTGTLGLYRAMKILGYNPYHMYECCVVQGTPHMKTLQDAVTAQHNRFSGKRKFEKPDFDRWLGDYDCIVEVASFIGKDAIKAYAADPDVKFILTERSPAKWAKSVNNTAGVMVQMAHSLPMGVLKHFNEFLSIFFSLNVTVYGAWSGSTLPGEADNERLLREYYVDYINMVKETVPADQLCVIRLEDGLDWSKICPFLGVPVPKEEYPDRNEPEKFQAMVQEKLQPHVTAAFLKLGAFVVPVLGVVGWMGMKYGPFVFKAISSAFA